MIFIIIMVSSVASFGRDFHYERDLSGRSRMETEASMEKNGRNACDIWNHMEGKDTQVKEEWVSMHSVRGSER